MRDVRIPTVSLGSVTEEAIEEWSEHIQSLFEWIGMACLGAQR
jgi:hypothetical protein